MTVTGILLAIILAVLTLVVIVMVGVPAAILFHVYRKRHEIRQKLDAIKTAESRLAGRNDWPGARLRPEDLRRPDGPEGSPRGPTP